MVNGAGLGDHVVHNLAEQSAVLQRLGEGALGEGPASHVGNPVLGLLLSNGVILRGLLLGLKKRRKEKKEREES